MPCLTVFKTGLVSKMSENTKMHEIHEKHEKRKSQNHNVTRKKTLGRYISGKWSFLVIKAVKTGQFRPETKPVFDVFKTVKWPVLTL